MLLKVILSFGTPHSFTGSGGGVAGAVGDESFVTVVDDVAEAAVVDVVAMVDVVAGAAVGLTEQYQLSK